LDKVEGNSTPEFWLNLQSLYEIRRAEQKSGKSIKALKTLRRAHLGRAKSANLSPPTFANVRKMWATGVWAGRWARNRDRA